MDFEFDPPSILDENQEDDYLNEEYGQQEVNKMSENPALYKTEIDLIPKSSSNTNTNSTNNTNNANSHIHSIQNMQTVKATVNPVPVSITSTNSHYPPSRMNKQPDYLERREKDKVIVEETHESMQSHQMEDLKNNLKPDVVLSPPKKGNNPNRPGSSLYKVKAPQESYDKMNEPKTKPVVNNNPPMTKKNYLSEFHKNNNNIGLTSHNNLNKELDDKFSKMDKFDDDKLDKAFAKMDNFESNLKKQFDYGFDAKQDSDYEDELIKEEIGADTFLTKDELVKRFQTIQDKYKEKLRELKYNSNQIIELQKKNNDFMDVVNKDTSADIKEKKIIELAKKNQDLQLKINGFKVKISKLEAQIKELHNDDEGNGGNEGRERGLKPEKIPPPKELIPLSDDPNELKKKVQKAEGKVIEMRNKITSMKDENTKLVTALKREVGDNVDIDKLVKDKTNWKGRSEIIETMKMKIKNLEGKLERVNNNADTTNLSIISEDNSIISNTNTNVTNNNTINRKINKTQEDRFISKFDGKKEKEQLKQDNDQLIQNNSKLMTEVSKLKSRRDMLEKELKSQREDLTDKIKILIDKSDNDEKLIVALNKEFEKLRKNYGANNPMGGYYNNESNTVFNMQQEIAKLRQDLRDKEAYITNLNSTVALGGEENTGYGNRGGDNRGIRQDTMELLNRIKSLEQENTKLKSHTEDGQIYESLARDNAKLRMKISEMEAKLRENNIR